MIILKRIILTLVGFSLLTITGCGSSQHPLSSAIPSVTIVAKQTFTPTSIIASQKPTATVRATTIVPTLESDKASKLLRSFVEGGLECMLPCWAGINPGVTSYTEAETLVNSFSVLIYGGPPHLYKANVFLGAAGGRNFLFGETNIRFNFSWMYNKDRGTVEMLRIGADALNRNSERLYGDESYDQLFKVYNIHGILSKYGIPSKVLTFAEVYNYGNDNPSPNPEEFQLLLLYDKGIFIEYTMPLKRIGSNKGKACPSEAFFNMGVVASEASQFYQEMWLSYTTGSRDFSYYLPIEKSTQMTLDEFYRVFEVSNNPCFEIPLTIWPNH